MRCLGDDGVSRNGTLRLLTSILVNTPSEESDHPLWVVLNASTAGVPMPDQAPGCDFCFSNDNPLFEGGFDSTSRI